MTATNSKTRGDSLPHVKFSISYQKRQELTDIMAHVQRVDKSARFDRMPCEESFTSDGWGAGWQYISRVQCAQPSRIVDAFREGLSVASPVSSVRLVIPASDTSAETTIVLTPGEK